MHPQLELLLEIQDLKSQVKDMEAAEESRELEREVFDVEPDEAIQQLQSKIEEMEKNLDAEVAGRYRLVSSRRGRAVVPVVNGVCYGCFMSMPTGVGPKNEQVSWCENCGAFVYYVD